MDKDLIARDEGGGVGRGFAFQDLVLTIWPFNRSPFSEVTIYNP
jgi:hypothetical protein